MADAGARPGFAWHSTGGDGPRDVWKLFIGEMARHPGTSDLPALREGAMFDVNGVFTPDLERFYIERMECGVAG